MFLFFGLYTRNYTKILEERKVPCDSSEKNSIGGMSLLM